MSAGEILLRAQKKAYQFSDKKYSPREGVSLAPSDAFPRLPNRGAAPTELVEGLRTNVAEILSGKWLAFGHLDLQVDDPPQWHRDYLAGVDRRSAKLAFKLDHRAQPGGADIKVIWEPSRWYQLVRLAMAAWLLDDSKAQEKCVEWLHDWNKNNPPFTGLNWTSGLEVGIRLVQFTWIDAMLAAAGTPNKTLQELREEILPPHTWYAWRYKSFGSSANNHLIGELAGLILALARWPDLAKISAPLQDVGAIFEREVLLQFAEDGGNEEQALGYHLFSWEFCWQGERALEGAGIEVSREVKDRIRAAGAFYAAIKPENDPWDFGDSDNAWVTPLFAREQECAREWWRWFNDSASSPALRFWWGAFPSRAAERKNEWRVFESGYAVFHSDDWFIRFDLSPLGYLSMAPHGHLDALHVSIWFRGNPVIIDPGTGAYYADKTVRNYLADWSAHNSPHLHNPVLEYPKRLGTFLWGEQHLPLGWHQNSKFEIVAKLDRGYGAVWRALTYFPKTSSIQIQDSVFFTRSKRSVVGTCWKFAPEFALKNLSPSELLASSADCSVRLSMSPEWTSHRIYNPQEELRGKTAATASALGSVPVQALVSPAFRSLAVAPYLALEASSEGPFTLTISPT